MDSLDKIIDGFKKDMTGAVMAELFTDYVNVMVFSPHEMAERFFEEDGRTKRKFTNLCLLWVYKLNYLAEVDTQRYDGRNKYSVDTGNLLYHEVKEYIDSMFTDKELNSVKKYRLNSKDEYYKDTDVNFEESFVQYMSLCHRTLQQTFSGIVFHWLVNLPEDLSSIYQVIGLKLVNLDEEKNFSLTPVV